MDSHLGIPSQCVRYANLDARKPGYFENVLLKINAKLGGVNGTVHKSMTELVGSIDDQTILFGIDVTHPSARAASTGAPSLIGVSVVCSLSHLLILLLCRL